MDVMNTQYRGKSRGLAWALALVILLSSPFAQSAKSFATDAGTDLKIMFNIPAGTLGKTLREFTAQAQIHALYVSSSAGQTVATHAVIGHFTPAEALTRMLEGTGVTFEFEHALSVLLRPPRRSRAVKTVGLSEEEPFVTAQEPMEAEPLQQVVITGSLIQGLEDITAPLMILAEKEKKQAAYGTVQDVLRTLPQNFGGGASEDYSFNENFNRGFGINLRGLGTGATLVLVNGRRQPASGIAGDFIDVSTIPWSAVERIDVLSDGSSALYGSDAIAGVVNIVMREDLPGVAETQTRFGSALHGAGETLLSQSFGHRGGSGKWMFTYQYSERAALAAMNRSYAANADKRPFGGSDLRSVLSSPGNILDPVTQLPAFGIAEHGLSSTINFHNHMSNKDLLPDREAHSAFFTMSRSLGELFELFAEGRYNQAHISSTQKSVAAKLPVPASNPFFVDPFGGSPYVLVAYNFLGDLGPVRESSKTTTYTGTLGAKTRIGQKWQATLSGHHGKEKMHWSGYNGLNFEAISRALADSDPLTAFNPFGFGSHTHPATLTAIRSTESQHATSDISVFSFVADGPLPDLPAGTPKLAVGLDYRAESLLRQSRVDDAFRAPGDYERATTAAFGELSVPLLPSLNLSLAARHETYSDFGETFNPKIGLRWTASDALRFRGSWGTSFRTPTLVDLYDKSNDGAGLIPVADPHSPNGFSLALVEQGSSPHLHKETARTWTAGIDFAPMALPGLTGALTYYATHYDDRLWRYQPPMTLAALLADDKWAPLVIRDPPRAEVERICRHPAFFGSSADCLASSPAVILDVRLRNLSATALKGIDMEVKQVLRTDFGSFDLKLDGSYVLGFEQSLTPAARAIDVAGNVLNPPRLHLRGAADWHQHGFSGKGWGASLSAHHSSSFRDENSLRVPRVEALLTFDTQLRYRTADNDAWFGGLDLALNAVNIFDQDPPFIDQEQGYDPTNARPFGRVVSFTVRKSW